MRWWPVSTLVLYHTWWPPSPISPPSSFSTSFPDLCLYSCVHRSPGPTIPYYVSGDSMIINLISIDCVCVRVCLFMVSVLFRHSFPFRPLRFESSFFSSSSFSSSWCSLNIISFWSNILFQVDAFDWLHLINCSSFFGLLLCVHRCSWKTFFYHYIAIV